LGQADVQSIEEREEGRERDVGVCEAGAVGASERVTAAGPGLWYHDREVEAFAMRVV
jgi:hypothetical protein